VDIEGAEVPLLRGALATIDRCRPIICGEFHSDFMVLHGTQFPDAMALLALRLPGPGLPDRPPSG
jgi:hypothetical protein